MKVEVTFSNPVEREFAERVEVDIRPRVLFGRLSRERLDRIGVGALGTRSFRTDAGVVEREMAAVGIEIMDRRGIAMVIIGNSGEQEFVGSHTLGSVGLDFDEAEGGLFQPVWPALLGDAEGMHRSFASLRMTPAEN